VASLDYLLIEKLKQLGKSVRFQGYQVKMATAPSRMLRWRRRCSAFAKKLSLL
jgi:hypothetical protein